MVFVKRGNLTHQKSNWFTFNTRSRGLPVGLRHGCRKRDGGQCREPRIVTKPYPATTKAVLMYNTHSECSHMVSSAPRRKPIWICTKICCCFLTFGSFGLTNIMGAMVGAPTNRSHNWDTSSCFQGWKPATRNVFPANPTFAHPQITHPNDFMNLSPQDECCTQWFWL